MQQITFYFGLNIPGQQHCKIFILQPQHQTVVIGVRRSPLIQRLRTQDLQLHHFIDRNFLTAAQHFKRNLFLFNLQTKVIIHFSFIVLTAVINLFYRKPVQHSFHPADMVGMRMCSDQHIDLLDMIFFQLSQQPGSFAAVAAVDQDIFPLHLYQDTVSLSNIQSSNGKDIVSSFHSVLCFCLRFWRHFFGYCSIHCLQLLQQNRHITFYQLAVFSNNAGCKHQRSQKYR